MEQLQNQDLQQQKLNYSGLVLLHMQEQLSLGGTLQLWNKYGFVEGTLNSLGKLFFFLKVILWVWQEKLTLFFVFSSLYLIFTIPRRSSRHFPTTHLIHPFRHIDGGTMDGRRDECCILRRINILVHLSSMITF